MPFPDVIAPDVRWHLACFAQDGDDGLVFTSPAGAPLRHSNFYRRVWVKALERVGMTGVHSTICATRETCSRPTRARTFGSWWTGWAMRAAAPR